MTIDKVDRQILSMLSENPGLSQLEISKEIGMSQPAISKRLRNLNKGGFLAIFAGVDFRKTGLAIAKVDLVTKETESILSFFNKCPIYLTGFVTSGRYNLCVLLMGENMSSIEACVDKHLRSHPNVLETNFSTVVTPIRKLLVPLKLFLNKKKISLCSKECAACSYYLSKRCLGCPSSIDYKGVIL
jgi:DNA-binding Lrp family transcriptional regulator